MTIAEDPNALIGFASALADASPPVMLAILIIALLRGWLILPRESKIQERRLADLKAERDEYKALAFKAVGLGERVANVAEQRKGEP